MKYSLIASDFDGTIYNGKEVSPRVKRAIADFREAGGRFVIATGRIYPSIRKLIPGVGADDYCVACQGAAFYRVDSGEAIKRFPLPRSIALKAFAYFEERNYVYHAYSDKEFFVKNDNPLSRAYAEYCAVEPTVAGAPLADALPSGFCPNKIMGIVPEDKTDDCINEVKALLGSEVEVTKSSPIFLEITSAKAGKGNCLIALAEHLGIPRERTVAVGDNLNDLSMIREAALGCAVGNAVDELKRAADTVLPPIWEDGVAVLIEKILKDEL